MNLSKSTRVHDAVPKQSSMYLQKKIRNGSCVSFEDLLFNITNKQVSVTWAHLGSHCYVNYLLVIFLIILLCICYCFSHLIGLLSVTWLSLLYKFTRFSIYFLFLSDEGLMLETLDYTIRIGSTPTFLYFDLYLYSAYAAHYVYFTFGSFTAATLCLISRSFVTV